MMLNIFDKYEELEKKREEEEFYLRMNLRESTRRMVCQFRSVVGLMPDLHDFLND